MFFSVRRNIRGAKHNPKLNRLGLRGERGVLGDPE
jgi:hypothetical protein